MVDANIYKILIPLDYQAGIKRHNSFLANVDPALPYGSTSLHQAVISSVHRSVHQEN